MLPYPPLFVGIGEWCDALSFQLSDGIIQFSCCLRNFSDTGIGQQLFVVHQHEQIAFNRQTQHFAVRGTHIGADRICHCSSKRLVGQIGTIFGKGIDISAGCSLEYIRCAACGDF
ncbi:hypothetical protein D3C75_952540 [compost metagenome]